MLCVVGNFKKMLANFTTMHVFLKYFVVCYNLTLLRCFMMDACEIQVIRCQNDLSGNSEHRLIIGTVPYY